MKNYLNFKLDGGKLFPYFIIIWAAVSFALILNLTIFRINPNEVNIPKMVGSFAVLFGLILVQILCMYKIYKLIINAITYDNISLKFDQRFSVYLKVIVKGILLSIITLGIYYPWFIRNLVAYFVDNSSHNQKRLQFKGSGAILFVIYFSTLTIYFVSTSLASTLFFINTKFLFLVPIFVIMSVLSMSALLYFVYKWYIDFKFDDKYSVSLNRGNNVSGILFIAGQMMLSVFTLGLYYPAALIRIFRYYARRVSVKDSTGMVVKKVGCDLTMRENFLFVFVQFLFSIVTLGVYLPWAFCFVMERFLSKTYTEEV